MRVNDSLWNIQNILIKFGKERRLLEDTTYIEEVMEKADKFVGLMKPFVHGRQRKDSICWWLGWWKSSAGGSEELIKHQLVQTLFDTAKVIELERKALKGGYATIKRV
jgi:hypothetical protein